MPRPSIGVQATPSEPSTCPPINLHIQKPQTGGVEYFEALALPFGASAAVHGFNRTASAINHILQKIFGIPCTHYFDDFTFILPKALAREATEAAKMVLEFPGWAVKSEKEEPIAASFVALGVNFDCIGATKWPKPFLVVSNKKSRIESLMT